MSNDAGTGGVASGGGAGDEPVTSGGANNGGGGNDGPRAGRDAGVGGTAGAGGSVGGSAQAGGSGGDGGMQGLAGEGGESGAAGDPGSGGSAGMGNLDPVSRQGLVYWFSADFGVTDEDEFITEWLDRSSNAAHALQPLPGSRPKLGTFSSSDLPAVVFDGTDDHLVMPPLDANFEAGLTFFAVARPTLDSTCMPMLELSNGQEAEDVAFFRHLGAFTYEVGEGVTHGQDVAFVLGQPRQLEVVHTADQTVTLFENGVATRTASFAIPFPRRRNLTYIGRSLYASCTNWSGVIAELILYSRPLSTTERQGIRTYLTEKWGCCGS